MGMRRKIETNLPQRLHFKNGAYYYVHVIDRKLVWEPMGRDEKPAIATALRLNDLKATDRVQALRKARAASEALRDEIMKRDGYRCVYCGSQENLGLDHIIPYVAGGATLPFKLVCACWSCNGMKGMGDPRDLILTLIGVRQQLLARAIDLLDKTVFLRQGQEA